MSGHHGTIGVSRGAAIAAAMTAAIAVAVPWAASAADLSRAEALATFDAAWSIVHETHFDPEFNGVDWDEVRRELRPRARKARTSAALRDVLRDMVGRLGQSHFALIPADAADRVAELTAGAGDPGPSSPSGSGGDVGIELRVVDGGPVVWRVDPDGPAAVAGVRTGWRPVEVDGVSAEATLEDLADYADSVGRCGGEVLAEVLAARFQGDPGSRVSASFEDGGGTTVSVSMTRRPVPGRWIRFGNLPPFPAEVETEERVAADGTTRVGVLRINVWMVPLMADIDAAIDRFRDHDGIVLDLRGNPGGVGGMVAGVAGHFHDDRVSLGTMRSRDTELRFVANPRRVDGAGRRVEPYAGPLAILIDEQSASTSEVFAAGMRDSGRATLFGTRTMGAALPALMDRLPNGDVLYHAIADYRAPSGDIVEGVGVEPDRPVPPTRRGLLDGRDEAMEAALAWIAERAATNETTGDGGPKPSEEDRP